MYQQTCGYEDGLTGEWDPDALQHHPEEDDQVPVLSDQREKLVCGLQEARLDDSLWAFFNAL